MDLMQQRIAKESRWSYGRVEMALKWPSALLLLASARLSLQQDGCVCLSQYQHRKNGIEASDGGQDPEEPTPAQGICDDASNDRPYEPANQTSSFQSSQCTLVPWTLLLLVTRCSCVETRSAAHIVDEISSPSKQVHRPSSTSY